MVSILGAGHVRVSSPIQRTTSSVLQARRRYAAFQAEGLGDLATRLTDLRKALHESTRSLERVRFSGGAAGGITPVNIRSSALGLNTQATASRLTSTEEVNTTPTSFTPRGPTWKGGNGSTSEVTVGGTYTGTIDDHLEIEIQKDRTVGGSKGIQIKVYGNAGLLQSTSIAAGTPADTPVTLSNGLTFSLGAGVVRGGDWVEVDVSASVGSAVDPTLALNGTRNDYAGLEDGFSVVDGSFDVNGVNIAVSASDSIDDVLARITASGAGVKATFDAATERIELVKTTDITGDIVLGGDTSGFLAATKLDGATAVLGEPSDLDKTLDDIATFAGVTAGSFQLNGVNVTVDPTQDTLEDVLDRIEGTGVDVKLSGDRITITSLEDVSISGDTSGFLAAIGVDEGDREAVVTTGSRMRPGVAQDVAQHIADLMKPINALFEELEREDLVKSDLKLVRGAVLGALARTLPEDAAKRLGLDLNLEAKMGEQVWKGGDRHSVDTIARAISTGPRGARALLLGKGRQQGMLAALDEGLDKALAALTDRYGSSGVIFSRRV